MKALDEGGLPLGIYSNIPIVHAKFQLDFLWASANELQQPPSKVPRVLNPLYSFAVAMSAPELSALLYDLMGGFLSFKVLRLWAHQSVTDPAGIILILSLFLRSPLCYHVHGEYAI